MDKEKLYETIFEESNQLVSTLRGSEPKLADTMARSLMVGALTYLCHIHGIEFVRDLLSQSIDQINDLEAKNKKLN